MASISKYRKTHSLERTRKRFSIFSRSTIDNIVKFMESGGSRSLKYKIVKKEMLELFEKARNRGDSIHYWHLVRWAKEIANKNGLENFKASLTFINKFKRSYRIVSRKITKFVTKKMTENDVLIRQSGQDFLHRVNEFLRDNNVTPSLVWNLDQS